MNQDLALGGQIHWRDLAMQIAKVWWEVNEVGGNLQHGDLDKESTSFSVVLLRHGGKVFHGKTPLDAWSKSKKWLMSPNRDISPDRESTHGLMSIDPDCR